MTKRILVVEDNDLNRKLFCDVLRANGFEVEPVADGEQVLGSARDFAPDLVIMVSEPAFAKIEQAAAAGNDDARELVSYFVGQGVGLVEQVRPARAVVQDFREEFLEAVGALSGMVETG